MAIDVWTGEKQPLQARAGDLTLQIVSANAAELDPPRQCQCSVDWRRVAAGVTEIATLAGFGAASQIFKGDFIANPGIATAAGLSAGVLARITTITIFPENWDDGVAHFFTAYGVHTFEALSILQQVLPQTDMWAQVWFPAIFVLAGYDISEYVIRKVTATKGNDANYYSWNGVRPLPDGDSRGSILPFFIEGAAIFTGGAISAGLGAFFKNYTAWRVGLVASGFGLGLPLSQQIFSRLRSLVDQMIHKDPGERQSGEGTPPCQSLMAILADLAPAIGKVGVCVAGGGLIMAPAASRSVLDNLGDLGPVFISIGVNIAIGGPAALIEMAKRDRFQHPGQLRKQAERDSLRRRCWRAITSRPVDCVGVGLVATGLITLLGTNIAYPSPGSIPAATILMVGTPASFGATMAIRAVCAAGDNKWLNLVNFRGAFSTHLVGLGFMIMLSNYYFGLIPPDNTGSYYLLNGLLAWLLGNVITESIHSARDLNFLLLLLVSVTAIGYIQYGP